MKRDIGYILLLLLTTAAIMTGCGGSDIIDDDNNIEAPKPLATSKEEIRVNTNVTSMMTRASTIDSNSELQDCNLKIDAYYNGTETACISDAKLHYDTDEWVFWSGDAETHYYWPIEGSVYNPASDNITVSSLDFVGYCPYDLSNTCVELDSYDGSGLSLTCTNLPVVNTTPDVGETTQANLKEFLWAYTTDQTKDTNSGTVDMSFKHPFAKVKFLLSAASGTNVTINSITISSIKNNGTCTFDGTTSTWTPSGDATNLVITGSPATGDTPYLVIPQTFAANLTFTVNATWDDWSDVTKDVSTTVDVGIWRAGYSYTYTLTLSKYALKVDTEKYTEQW